MDTSTVRPSAFVTRPTAHDVSFQRQEMVDEAVITALVSLFDPTPNSFAFRDPVPQQIHSRRAQLCDVLIFDILLSSGNIRHPDALYPPTDIQGLRRLLTAIEESSYDALKKDCLVYFLLKWHRDERASQFQASRSIPPQFGALADAYWSLDCGIDVPVSASLQKSLSLYSTYCLSPASRWTTVRCAAEPRLHIKNLAGHFPVS